jgi:hypothetical protein
MKSGTSFIRRFVPLAVAGILVVVLAACTGRGGGYLPPDGVVYKGQASFGFTFSCEKGELKIQLAYSDKGSSPLLRPPGILSPFGIHGTVDVVDPVLESAVCIDQNPPPESEFGNQLIFLGRYRLISGSPAGFPTTCKTTTPLCRFEVIVRDNDQNFAPSPGDSFSITLSTAVGVCTDFSCSQLPAETIFYTRAGNLAGGNLTVR